MHKPLRQAQYKTRPAPSLQVVAFGALKKTLKNCKA